MVGVGSGWSFLPPHGRPSYRDGALPTKGASMSAQCTEINVCFWPVVAYRYRQQRGGLRLRVSAARWSSRMQAGGQHQCNCLVR